MIKNYTTNRFTSLSTSFFHAGIVFFGTPCIIRIILILKFCFIVNITQGSVMTSTNILNDMFARFAQNFNDLSILLVNLEIN